MTQSDLGRVVKLIKCVWRVGMRESIPARKTTACLFLASFMCKQSRWEAVKNIFGWNNMHLNTKNCMSVER